MPRFIVLFDIDETINFNTPFKRGKYRFNPRTDYYHAGKALTVVIQDEMIADHYDTLKNFLVPKTNFFRMTFDILQRNKVLCVIASNRLVNRFLRGKIYTRENDIVHVSAIAAMYAGLDACFSATRNYLTKDLAEMLWKKCQNLVVAEKWQTKKTFLQILQEIYKLPSQQLILIDDQVEFENVEQYGYAFIQATPDLAHLMKILVQCVSLHEINSCLTQFQGQYPSEDLSQFSTMINSFVRNNLKQARSWQASLLELLRNEQPNFGIKSLFQSFSLLTKLHSEYLIEHRHEDCELQQAYDRKFGLIVRP